MSGSSEHQQGSHGGKKAIIAALLANAGIAVAKFVGYLITGSSSMLAEAVHSVADTSNQGLLLFGQKRSERPANALHQFGYGRNRYFYSFVVALVLFTMGSMFAIYEGIHKIQHPEELSSAWVAIAILLVAIGLETYSFLTARKESLPLKGDGTWWQFIRNSRSPELPVVLLEDTGALIGLVLALAGVSLTMITGDGVWDGIGTLCIGALLGVIAVVLIIEMQSLLIGEGATAKDQALIELALAGGRVERVIHLRTQYMSPDELLVAAKLALPEATTLAAVAEEIDAAEARVRAAVPAATLIYLEPDLDRAAPADDRQAR